jgi:hypothetical protein
MRTINLARAVNARGCWAVRRSVQARAFRAHSQEHTMEKRPFVIDDLEHPVAPATADVSALAPVIIPSPSTAVIVGSPATPQSIG